jgi:4-amino-4-deoxy-L-arabinose transferase-like glycosyltransferase
MPDRGRERIWIALTVLAAAAVYLAGNGSVSLFDRDEPRYAQCSRQMLQSGDWVVPRLYDQVRTAKPPFIYWCQATAMRLLGDTAFAARLPSALAMPLTLAVVAGFVRRAAGPRRAAWTVLVLATSGMVLISAKACLTDSVLLLCTTLAQFCLYAIWRGRGTWPVVLTLAVALGVAGLTKGPVIVGVQAMTVLTLVALNRTVPRRGPGGPSNVRPLRAALKAIVALFLVAAIVGPWLYRVEQRSPGFLGISVAHDVVRRTTTGLEQHGGPPGYHLATIWVFFLPWSLLLPLALVTAWKHRHLPLVRFALAAVIGPWLMFEVVRTKLPHYMLPTYPFLAILVADAVVRCLRGELRDLDATPFRVAVAVFAVLLAIASTAPVVVASRFLEDPIWPGVVLAAAGWAVAVTLGTLLVWPKPQRRHPRLAPGLIALGVGTLALWSVAWTIFLPRAQFLRLSIRAAGVLRQEGATGRGEAVMVDYKEPTLAFYQGGTIREGSQRELTHAVLDRSPPWLVITADLWQRAPIDVRARLTVYARFRGIAYADEGRWVEVMVVRVREKEDGG